tara:strand:+ start:600 stop:926 length:327 start_codon:yes stop_codon:yes gene_type:complete
MTSIFSNLPNDLIINIIKQENKRAIQEIMEESKYEHEDKFNYIDDELSYYFVDSIAEYENVGVGCCEFVKTKDAVYFSPFQVLKEIRKERKINKIHGGKFSHLPQGQF